MKIQLNLRGKIIKLTKCFLSLQNEAINYVKVHLRNMKNKSIFMASLQKKIAFHIFSHFNIFVRIGKNLPYHLPQKERSQNSSSPPTSFPPQKERMYFASLTLLVIQSQQLHGSRYFRKTIQDLKKPSPTHIVRHPKT